MATGAQFLVGNQTYTANASKEVILAASTVQTPQLLELSGIGNSTLLKSLGITPLIDLPGVGENLQVGIFISTPSIALLNDRIGALVLHPLLPAHARPSDLRYDLSHFGFPLLLICLKTSCDGM